MDHINLKRCFTHSISESIILCANVSNSIFRLLSLGRTCFYSREEVHGRKPSEIYRFLN